MERWYLENEIGTVFLEFLANAIPRIAAAPVQPSLVFQCLRSIPFNQTTALRFVRYLQPLMEWHSTLDYFQSPPPGYLSDPVDLVSGLKTIEETIASSGYSNEFDFHADLHKLLVTRVRDGHFIVTPLLLHLFTFQRGVAFVSVSEDGRSVPQVFAREDVKHREDGYCPSPVNTVNGEPAIDYLQRLSTLASATHDPDARYNTVFQTLSKESHPAYWGQDHDILGINDSTLENETILEYQNKAYVRANFTDIVSGRDVFARWVDGGATGDIPLPWPFYTWLQKNFTNNLAGFPRPSHSIYDGSMAGFLPSHPALSQVSVLVVSSFGSGSFNPDFQVMVNEVQDRYDTAVDFIRAAKAAGKTRLILDLQSNPGGLIPLLWQHRAHDQLEWLVHEGDRRLNTSNPLRLPIDLQNYLQPDGSRWDSFTTHFGPVSGTKGLYTRSSLVNVTHWLNHPMLTMQYRDTWSDPPFRPEDIVILLDGECASSCAIFTASLVHGQGVRMAAAGRRALEAPMQGVGQVKGGAVITFPVSPPVLPDEYTADLGQVGLPEGKVLFTERDLPRNIGSLAVNEANMVPIDGIGDIPLQFTYEAANCKIFFTWDMLRAIENLWHTVANVTWNGAKCEKGSITEEDGRMGGVPPFRKSVEDKYHL
ncbi:hypothetical protein B0T16DRAFT_427366 [Cercophora newfieldiana]|uniref:CPAF-like PDZ domain-containing protein n=1 Tax=Cercophora newfieldiana TaxID=92897 RepID=A0AA39YIC7_9PEZI|nr:hypothetical protein B0T16DRAFT_427366 [Cercophora newfieldiana]